MRIYLDTNILQDLKKEAKALLLQKIREDGLRNTYCFSEAHIYDLSRDKSDEKFSDMAFMEEVVSNNCFFFDKKICFEYRTPTEYYNSFDWSYTFDTGELFSGDDLGKIMETVFKAIPLDFKTFISSDQLSGDIPLEFRDLLEQPTNYYEFFQVFLQFSEGLSNEQKRFKAFIQYLHQNSLITGIYEVIGINGYDGINITDKDKFRESYSAYFSRFQKRNNYELFSDMFYGLEFFGFVKGKPRKQKMMNLINDSRHAFFGAHCDVVVSKDIDFCNKTKFMYQLLDIDVQVLSLEEFEAALDNWPLEHALTVMDLIGEASKTPDPSNIIREEVSETSRTVYFELPNTFLSFFNMYGISFTDKGNYTFFSKKPTTLSSGTFVKEIIIVVEQLISFLGPDVEGRTTFQVDEINDGVWIGRNWIVGDSVIQLTCPDKLFLSIIPLTYFEESASVSSENTQ